MNRAALAEYLRFRRGKVQPSHVGLPNGTRRRTPGLRRQEVAELAGISIDYYIRLEQARGPKPSRQVLSALSRALLLNIDERAHLLHLANETPEPSASLSRDVPEGIHHILAAMTDVPAYVVDAKYSVLAANPLALRFLPKLPRWPDGQVNIARVIFTEPEAAMHLDDPNSLRFAKSCVADLRAAAARYPDDAELSGLIDELLRGSPEFGQIWAEHEVETRRNMTKRINHPVVGPIEVECQVLLVPDRDHRVIMYAARPGSPSQQKMRRLRDELAVSDS